MLPGESSWVRSLSLYFIHLFQNRTSSDQWYFRLDAVPVTKPRLPKHCTKQKALTPTSGLALSFLRPPPDSCLSDGCIKMWRSVITVLLPSLKVVVRSFFVVMMHFLVQLHHFVTFTLYFIPQSITTKFEVLTSTGLLAYAVSSIWTALVEQSRFRRATC